MVEGGTDRDQEEQRRRYVAILGQDGDVRSGAAFRQALPKIVSTRDFIDLRQAKQDDVDTASSRGPLSLLDADTTV